jgi:hypothetical protein
LEALTAALRTMQEREQADRPTVSALTVDLPTLVRLA